MAFLAKDRTKVESLLSSLTTTMDSVGKAQRDIKLLLRLNPQWPDAIKSVLGIVQIQLLQTQSLADQQEGGVVEILNQVLPPE